MKMEMSIAEPYSHPPKMAGDNSNTPMVKDLWERGTTIKYTAPESTSMKMEAGIKESFSIIKGKATASSK